MTGVRERVLVTGGAGFIGSAVCRHLVASGFYVINVDNLTYSGNLESLRELNANHAYAFYRENICNAGAIGRILREERVGRIMHLAAETHVDRSIDGPGVFVETNVVGTFRLLEAALGYWRELGNEAQARFRFHHVSTDEVFGDLSSDQGCFTEGTPYDPSSPYSASKAASDHFVRAWHRTYGLPVVLSNCSNNYGPYHFPEKLIPLIILNALEGKTLPVYGRGLNIRDWLHVEDHARALELIIMGGRIGESYVVGGRAERTNLQVVEAICDLLDERQRLPGRARRRNLITFVDDRPGHDRRYAIDPSRIETDLGWRPEESFDSGLAKTVDWYLANEGWWRPIRDGRYAGQRLGTAN